MNSLSMFVQLLQLQSRKQNYGGYVDRKGKGIIKLLVSIATEIYDRFIPPRRHWTRIIIIASLILSAPNSVP